MSLSLLLRRMVLMNKEGKKACWENAGPCAVKNICLGF